MRKHYSAREFKLILNHNGYVYVRTKGSHSIYKKGSQEIVINEKLNMMVCHRLIKENNLVC